MPTMISLDRSRLHHVAALAEAIVASGDHASAVIAVADRHELLWQHVVSGRMTVTAASIFPIASITKPIIVTAIMQLVERGLLFIGDPVVTYLPEFGRNGKDGVTVRHLLTHTSGLAEDPAMARLVPMHERRAPRADYLALACDCELERPPGERSVYRQLPFTVLAELIARLGGRDYPIWLREEIFAPLGMVDTTFWPTDRTRLAQIPFYPDEPENAEEWAYVYDIAFPAHGLYSTAADLVAFGQALLGGGRRGMARILSSGAVAAMTTPQPGLVADTDTGTRPVYSGLTWGCRVPTATCSARRAASATPAAPAAGSGSIPTEISSSCCSRIATARRRAWRCAC